MAKKVAVVTWDAGMVRFYAGQVREFFGDDVDVDCYSVQDGTARKIGKADLYLVSTCAYDDYENVNEYLPLGGEIVVTRVTITKDALVQLQEVPRGTRALMVNINPRMAIETMSLLNQLGVNNIEFMPYYPEMREAPKADMAVTPGETRYVPAGISRVLDVGHRVLTPDTLAELALKLGLSQILESGRFKDYLNAVVDNDYSFRRLFDRSIELESLFEILLGILDMGVIGVDDENRVFAYNRLAQHVTGQPKQAVIGRDAGEVLPFIPFDECRKTQMEQKSRLVKVQEVDVNVNVTPVLRKGRFIGAFAIVQKFTDAENKQHKLRMQLMDRGHKTKYTFEDILGESPVLRKACDVARRMARTNSAVLITGESGTGKELFAHAIHNASGRSAYPFVAINCAAIADNLLESELFGYEEGAFTGAKKGGKPGFFEFAHRGTLFLDEIEGMSQPLQLKLLRVVQEQEVMRVGGNKVICVDVRIVAATNENLMEMMEKGSFRKDLYYRLNALPLRLPPLREREGDVLLLMNFMKQRQGSCFALSPEAEEILLRHRWEGNIRELRNCVDYLTYLEKPLIEPEDLPPEIYEAALARKSAPVPVLPAALPTAGEGAEGTPFAPSPEQHPAAVAGEGERAALLRTAGKRRAEYAFVLESLWDAGKRYQSLGRKSIAEAARTAELFLTEQEVRGILEKLEELGAVRIGRGRGGSRITPLGAALCESGALIGENG